MNMTAIEIDIDVYKAIESNRTSFSQSANDILKGLIGLGGQEIAMSTKDGAAWSSKGVTLAHGTQLRMDYNGRRYEGRIDDGEWLCDGQRFSGPSAAAGGVARTKNGSTTSLNGWNYWEVKAPGSTNWQLISNMRKF